MPPEHALLTIALYAAFADGNKDEREREQIRRIADDLGRDAPALPKLYQDVLLKRVALSDAVAALTDLGQRQLAFEMAVCVCDADGLQSPPEKVFLGQLRDALGLQGNATAAAAERQVDAVADLAGSVPVHAAPLAAVTTTPPAVDTAALDKRILNYSILNGALELLPQSWASVAIIPLQMKMVYRIGRDYGFELDQGHIKEFLATAGVGLTSQYLEQFGRKLLGGLLTQMVGRTAGRLGGAATGIAFSFASTYALGHLAKRYYGGGRQMSGAMLKEEFQRLLPSARALQQDYVPQIRQKASSLDATQVMALVRGQGL